MPERTTVRLPEDLLIRAKQKAAAEKRTLTSLIEEGLRTILAAPRQAKTAKRVLPRVSVARGGLVPGVDLTNLSTLQDAEDLEYVRRMRDAE
jgi:hypothetical protein